jgi:hypothetical protein
LTTELRARAKGIAANNGTVQFLFGSREDANLAIDLLRAQSCEIESLTRATSSLEEVFIRTIEGNK